MLNLVYQLLLLAKDSSIPTQCRSHHSDGQQEEQVADRGSEVDQETEKEVQGKGSRDEVFDGTALDLQPKDKIRQEQEVADGEGQIGTDGVFGRPELSGEELGEGEVRCAFGSAVRERAGR